MPFPCLDSDCSGLDPSRCDRDDNKIQFGVRIAPLDVTEYYARLPCCQGLYQQALLSPTVAQFNVPMTWQESIAVRSITTMFTAKGEGLPPPYEVEAYTYRRPLFHGPFRRPSLKKCLSALCLLSLVSYVCFEAGRASHSTGAAADTYAARAIVEFEASVGRCAARSHVPHIESPEARVRNPRWTQVRGQKETIALRNVSLFDGESFSPAPVDIIFSKGLVLSVSEASTAPSILESGVEYNLNGRFVTPGLVDMHSHHLAMAWPGSEALDDTNGMLLRLHRKAGVDR